jgi:hypothetical protein
VVIEGLQIGAANGGGVAVYLAVDVLDECAQGRSELIHLISTSLNLSQKVRWLLSSRLEVDVLATLKDRATNSLDATNSFVELDT